MSTIDITLPDGSKRPVEPGTRPSISPSPSALASPTRPSSPGSTESCTTHRPRKGRRLADPHCQGPESLNVYRHSSAIFWPRVLELYPETKLGIGRPSTTLLLRLRPPRAVHPEDLERIEKKMWELQSRDLPYERIYTRKDEGLKKYADAWMKCELIAERAGEIFSEYTLGPHFIDFCRVPRASTSKIKAFKLLSIAGAYWRATSTTSSCSASTAPLLHSEGPGRVSQAGRGGQEARPPQAGRELDLFSIQELAPRLIFFHPRAASSQAAETDARPVLKRGYSLVYTPHVAASSCGRRRARRFLRQNMFSRMELDDAEYQLKPMNCPSTSSSTRISSTATATFRSAWASSHRLRYERSGVLNGLFRVRASRRTTPTSSVPGADRKTKLSTACNSRSHLTTYGFHEYIRAFHLDGGARASTMDRPSSGSSAKTHCAVPPSGSTSRLR